VSDCEGSIRFNTFAYDTVFSLGSGVLAVSDSDVDVEENTFYACHAHDAAQASAAVFFSTTPFTFGSNVIVGCSGAPAVGRTTGFQPIDGCNLFWGNADGDFNNYVPAPTDVFADPLFCDTASVNLRVQGDSPCVEGNTPGCGAIGAWGVGCIATGTGASMDAMSWGGIKGLYRKGVE
jgi:hypothetical protein